MNLESRKYQIIERVMNLSEEEVDHLENILSSESALSQSLDFSLQQVADGRTTPHQEVKKRYEKWL